MPHLIVDFDEEESKIALKGDLAAIVGKPLFRTFARKYSAIQESPDTLTFTISREKLSTSYLELKKILARYNLGVSPSDDVSSALQSVLEAELEFASFSNHADQIWHANLDTVAFRDFVDVVGRTCPGRTFYRLQLLAAFHLAFSQNVCNFSVPGAGKTSIVYAAYAYLREQHARPEKHVNHLLIVGPLSSFKAWEDEYADIFLRHPRVTRISGAMPRTERRDYLRNIDLRSRSDELTLTSYQTLSSAEEDFKTFLSSPHRRTMMVLDEAHYVKREDGEWAASALALAPFARSRVVLTGTPAPNGYEDLGNLFKFLYPNKSIVGFSQGTLRAMSDGGMPAAVETLKKRVRPFYTRIKKSDLNLPRIEEHRVPVPMGAEQESIYRGIERLIVPNLRDALTGDSTLIRARLIRLRQAATNPALLLRPIEEDIVLDGSGREALRASEVGIADLVRQFSPRHALVRLQEAKRIISEIIAVQGKVLVWSVFLGNLALLREELRGFADYVECISGSTPIDSREEDEDVDLETREKIINRFHRPNESAILIANPQAVGESISLHKACHSAVYFDRDFNAGRFIQSKDRIHRYGLDPDRDVTRYYYLNAHGTVDDDIDVRLSLKERRLMDLIDSDEIPLFAAASDRSESYEDIRSVIESYERRKRN